MQSVREACVFVRRRLNVVDAAVLAGFFIFAVAWQIGSWKGAYPFMFLSSDAANIASFAAALDHPDLFVGDAVLGDARNFRFYNTIHIPILRALTRITGDYGTSFISLLGLHVFLQAVGFYILGRVLFHRRFWAGLYAVLTLMPVPLNLGEFWGIYKDPIPRFSFQVLLPYLLAAAIYWRRSPGAWPWLMATAGLLMYVHPVSAPGWGLALWVGFLGNLPQTWGWRKRVGFLILLGSIFLLVISPNVLLYVRNHAYGTSEIPYQQVYPILEFRIIKGYLNIPSAIKSFIQLWHNRWLVWIGACLGAVWLGRKTRRTSGNVRLISQWLVGLGMASLVIPYVEQVIARTFQWIPIEIDLVRGIRYFVPLMLIFCIWPLAEITQKFATQSVRDRGFVRALHVAGALIAMAWVFWHPPTMAAEGVVCWARGKAVCMDSSWRSAIDAIHAVQRETPPQSTILPTALPLQIRYVALRSVVLAWKDGGILAYANHRKLSDWYRDYQAMEGARLATSTSEQLRRYREVGRGLEAQYLFTNLPTAPDEVITDDLKLRWANQQFSLFELQ